MIKLKLGDKINAYAIPGINDTDQLVFQKRKSEPDNIKKVVSREFGIPVCLLDLYTRKEPIITARQMSMTIIKERTDLPLKEIGRMFGIRKYDHTTVRNAIITTRNKMKVYKGFKERFKNVEANLTEK